MSGFEAIQNRIIERAKDEAAALVREAVEEKDRKISSAQEEVKQLRSRMIEDAKTEAAVRHEERLGAIRTELKRQLLTRREELIGQAWEQALEEMKDYVKGEEYRGELKDLVVRTAGLVEGDTFLVDANPRDLATIGELKEEIEEALSREKGARTMVLGREIGCTGGVEMSDPERSIVLDRTYEAKIRRLKPELRSKLAVILTGGLE
jgi:vacuolar-type H+-ATPase subunit E/Vma4